MNDFYYNNDFENNNEHGQHSEHSARKRGMAVVSMVLGIASLVLCVIPILPIALGGVGLTLGIIAKKRGGGGFALAGIITSAFGIALSVMIIVCGVIIQFLLEYLQGGNFPNSTPGQDLPGSKFSISKVMDGIKKVINF